MLLLLSTGIGLNKDNNGGVIPHQASLRIIDAVAHRFGASLKRFLINMNRYV